MARGIGADIMMAALAEYDPERDRIVGYIDAISGEGSTMDIVRLLIEANRTDMQRIVDGDRSVLITDNREFPLTCYGEAEDIAEAVVDRLGGVIDLRRPRESGPFPGDPPGWNFGSLTYGGMGELAVSLLVEHGYPTEWETLAGLADRSDLSPVSTAGTEYATDD